MIRKSTWAMAFFFFASVVSAEPSFSWRKSGSSFLIDTVNTERNAYRCIASYDLSYVQYGSSDSKHFVNNFYVERNYKGNVVTTNTSWAASTLDYSNVDISCKESNDVFPAPNKAKNSFSCPAGLTLIGNMYGESPSGGGAFIAVQKVSFPSRFELDTNYKQNRIVQTAGGGAHSDWDGKSGIPSGVYIYATGGHYWSVGVKPDVGPQVSYDESGSIKSIAMRNYCGPEGWPGPGCNVNVFVCAKHR